YLKVFAYVTPVKTNFDVFKKSGIENIYYIPFVYPVSGSANKKPQNKNIKIISVGKFVKRKDHLLLLNVTERLIKDGFAVKLTLAGEIQNPEIHKTVKKYINEHNLAKTVNIKTDIPYPEMKNEYRKHDLFVLPSRKEPAAYSVTEAAANALPVICSDENGTSCYIENGINGCVFKAGNENDLYQKIKLCITDTEKLRKMSEAALNSAKKNHNPEIFAETITEIVKTQK
ncbi:MAG: glycosyltransferase, partial [Chlorobi bacterium]|nr:glycosyltransferase [Chlorobiota bacterium]